MQKRNSITNYRKVLILGNDEKENSFVLTSLTQVSMIETNKVRVSCYRDYALWLVKDKSYYGGADKVIILNSSGKVPSLVWQEEVRKSLGEEVSIYHLYGSKEQKLSLLERILV